MTLRPYKFIVQAVPQEVDDEGNVVNEIQAQPVVLFGCEQLAQWAMEFPGKLENAEVVQQNGNR